MLQRKSIHLILFSGSVALSLMATTEQRCARAAPCPAFVAGVVAGVSQDSNQPFVVVAANRGLVAQEVDRLTEELPTPKRLDAGDDMPTPADAKSKPGTAPVPANGQATAAEEELPAPNELTPSPLPEAVPKAPPYLGARVAKNGIGSVTVVRVRHDSPAARAKLLVGDAITSIDRRPVASFENLVHAVHHKGVGDVVQLSVLRGNRPLKLEVRLAAPAME